MTNDVSILNNMHSHYSSLLKNNCRSLGADEISKSIFEKIDTNKSYELSQEEITVARPNLKTIIAEIACKYTSLINNIFGEKYSQQLEKANNNPTIKDINNTYSEEVNSSHKIILQNLQDAANKIKEFAKNHPENNRIQKIASNLDVIMKNIQVTNEDKGYIAETITGDNKIIFNATSFENLDPDNLLKNFLHELAHYIDGDELSSIAEELDVEAFAIETTEDILGTTFIENKEEYLTEFKERYNYNRTSNYGESSPGYNGIPINAGFVIKNDIVSIEQNKNSTVITSDFAGWKQEHKVIMGENKDKNGNPLPIYAEKVIYTDDGSEIKFIYSDYNEDRKVWLKESVQK